MRFLPEQGHIRPGEVIVGGDSHYLAHTGLLRPSVPVLAPLIQPPSIATGRLWFKVPVSMKIVLNGSLPTGVYSKDVIFRGYQAYRR